MIKGDGFYLKYLESVDLASVYELITIPHNAKNIISNIATLTMSNIGSYLSATEMGTTALPMGIFTDKLVGITIINNIHPVKRSACFSALLINDDYKKTPIPIRAASLIAKYLFTELNLHRIYATTWDGNGTMDRIYEKWGFQLEGIQRHESFIDGEWIDKKLWAVLKDEFNFEFSKKLAKEKQWVEYHCQRESA